MYSSNIFPPIFNKSYVPAFIYTGVCRIYFSLSEYNSINSLHKNNDEIDGVQVIVNTQNTNRTILKNSLYPSGIKLTTLSVDTTRETDDKYYVEILNSDTENGFTLNEYYKVQIRLTEAGAENPPTQGGIDNWLSNNTIYFSEWSRVVLIRGISAPSLQLNNYPDLSNEIDLHTTDLDLSGQIVFAEESDTEVLKNYYINLYDENDILLESSGWLLSLNNEIEYSIKHYLQVGQTYKVKIQIITENLYSWTEPQEIIFNIVDNLEPILDISIESKTDNKTGEIKLLLINEDNTLIENDNLVIKRASSINDFTTWETLYSFILQQNNIQNLLWKDYTIQPGVWYKYLIIKKNQSGNRISSIQTQTPLMVDTEDIFLNADNKQLIIRFDPQINNIVLKTSQSITETIGSQYPFIQTNGNINYKTFSLSGTISYFMDISHNLLKASKSDIFKNSKTLYDNYNAQNNINLFKDAIFEREFRKQVIAFLNKNNIKLFRSLTQGNLLIKISNITLSPFQNLNRQIYSFSCTVTEIDDCSIENFHKYHIISNDSIEYNINEGGF